MNSLRQIRNSATKKKAEKLFEKQETSDLPADSGIGTQRSSFSDDGSNIALKSTRYCVFTASASLHYCAIIDIPMVVIVRDYQIILIIDYHYQRLISSIIIIRGYH